MAERQPSWDKYEAAILLEGILASMKGELTRSDAVKAVSHDLRAMAVHRGIEIDAVYRNTNGISFQMKSMESAYLGRTVFKPATRLFTGVASLYHDSHDEYQKLLKEARAKLKKTWYGGKKRIPTTKAEQRKMKEAILKVYPEAIVIDDNAKRQRELDWIDRIKEYDALFND